MAATAVLAVIAVGGVLAASGGAGASGGALPPAEQVLAAKAQADAAHRAWVAQHAVPWRAPKTGPAAPTSCPVALPQPTVHLPMVGGHDGLATRLSQGATSAAGVAYYFTSGSAAGAPDTGAVYVLRDGPDPCRGAGLADPLLPGARRARGGSSAAGDRDGPRPAQRRRVVADAGPRLRPHPLSRGE